MNKDLKLSVRVELSGPLADELNRWFATMVQNVGPKVSTEAYNALMVARDNLNAILTAAAQAANPE